MTDYEKKIQTIDKVLQYFTPPNIVRDGMATRQERALYCIAQELAATNKLLVCIENALMSIHGEL